MNETMNTPTVHAAAEPKYVPPDERRARGKALREAVPREAHGHWKPANDRHDIVDLLMASNEGRMEQLVPIRFGRMMQSPFTFYRGSAAVMAADLASTPASGIRVQACGDAHLTNFGGFATPERRIIFDINDFDETLPAPWEWDLKRLAASVVVAGRQIRLSESDAARAARATVRSYRERMSDYASMRALDVWYDRIDVDRFLRRWMAERRERIRQRLERLQDKNVPEFLFPKLVEHRGSTPRIKDDPPLIFHPTAEQAPGLETTTGRRSRSIASRWPSIFASCSTAITSATWRSRSWASAASARCPPLRCSWLRTTIRFSCRSRKRRRPCSNPTPARASTLTMANGSWSASA